MASLGRRGGLRGGRARAAALTPAQRTEIAREAARARWGKPALVLDRRPRNHGELLSFVAHYGARVSRITTTCRLEDVVLQSVKGARGDPALARMLPVFLWRVRGRLDPGRLAAHASRRGCAAALGYFLELASRLGRCADFGDALLLLKSCAHPERPTYFFRKAARNPFEAMVARERTPRDARRWGLLTGTPTDSFASYFRKVARL